LNRTPFISRREALDKYAPSRREEVKTVPKFIDAHPMKPFTADELNKLQNAPPDEFGVTHHDILFSEKENKIFCVLEGPNAEAIHKHHAKAGIKCDWIHEVKSTRG
jgi:Protein of unknown function (DUF4242)